MNKIKGVYRYHGRDITIDITECVNYFANLQGFSVFQVINYFSDQDYHFHNYNNLHKRRIKL